MAVRWIGVDRSTSPGIFLHNGTRATANTKARKHESPKTPPGMKHSFEQVSADIIGAALAVHKELGPGFLESVYHSAMRVALAHRSIPFESQFLVDVYFESESVGRARIDLVVAHEVVLELKAVEALRDVHYVQLKSYLRATRLQVGLLLNFNASTLVIKRVVQN
jgi:GxxExxY protein